MCVIIGAPKGSYLTKEIARQAWDQNPDGGGFVYYNGEEFIVYKTLKFKDFWSKFEQARSEYKTDFLVHMRIKTHGDVCIDNVHPFEIQEGTAWLAHNGIIHQVPDYKDGRSDTKVFVDEVDKELPRYWWTSPYLVDMVGEWIGWSKFAILDNMGLWYVNEHKGTWHQKMWFSNSFSLPVKGYTVTNKKGSGSSKSDAPALYYENGYEAWWADANDKVTQITKPKNKKEFVFPRADDPSNHSRDQLIRNRGEGGLDARLAWDAKSSRWFCQGCLDDIADVTGECACYDLVDENCGQYLGFCECEYMDRNIVDPYDDVYGTTYQPSWIEQERAMATADLEQF